MEKKMVKVKVYEKFFIRNTTIDGYMVKQYFTVMASFNSNIPVLVIKKYILSKDIIDLDAYKIVKKYKDKYLYFSMFTIKMDTLSQVVNRIYHKK